VHAPSRKGRKGTNRNAPSLGRGGYVKKKEGLSLPLKKKEKKSSRIKKNHPKRRREPSSPTGKGKGRESPLKERGWSHTSSFVGKKKRRSSPNTYGLSSPIITDKRTSGERKKRNKKKNFSSMTKRGGGEGKKPPFP